MRKGNKWKFFLHSISKGVADFATLGESLPATSAIPETWGLLRGK